MVTLRSQKRTRSRGSITALKTTKKSQSQLRSAYTGSTRDVDGTEVESRVSSPVSVTTRSRSQTSSQKETERCRRRVRFGTNRDNMLKNATTEQRRQHQNQSVGSAVLEIEDVASPFSLQWMSQASSHDYVSRCAVNRAARIAKRANADNRQRFTGTHTATLPAKATNDKSAARKQRGPKVKYLPDTDESMTDKEVQHWRVENRKRRNLQTARASIESKILYMKELERDILDYKKKVKDVHDLISNMQPQPTTAPPNWMEPQQLLYPHRLSNGDTIMLPRFFVPTLRVPVP